MPSPDRDILERLLADLPADEREAARPVLAALLAQADTADARGAQARIRGRIRTAIAKAADSDPVPSPTFSMKHLFSGALGFAAALLVAGGYLALTGTPVPAPVRPTQLARMTAPVRTLSERAFDNDLVISPSKPAEFATGRGGAPATDSAQKGMGEAAVAPAPDAGTAPQSAPVPPTGGGAGGFGVASATRVAPEFMNPEYRYTFTGRAIQDVPGTLDVIRVDAAARRGDLTDAARPLLRALGTGNAGTMQRLGVHDGGEKGYVLDFDLQNGTISAMRDWARWGGPDGPKAVSPTGTGATIEDADAIRIANDFLRAHGISLDGLDAPRIDDSWKRYAPVGGDAKMLAMPPQQSTTVLYGRSFGGRPLLTWDGQPDGFVRVTVNATDREVEYMNGWLPVPLAASAYPAVASEDAVVRANKGGINRPWSGPAFDAPGASRPVVQIALTEMRLGYIQRALAAKDGMTTYFVPVYIFTGTQTQDGSTYPTTVMVPAVTGEFFRDEERMLQQQEEEMRYEVGKLEFRDAELFADAYVRSFLKEDASAVMAALSQEAKDAVAKECGADIFTCSTISFEGVPMPLDDVREGAVQDPVPSLEGLKTRFASKRDGEAVTVRVLFEAEGRYVPNVALRVLGAKAPFSTDTWRFPNYGQLDGGAQPPISIMDAPVAAPAAPPQG